MKKIFLVFIIFLLTWNLVFAYIPTSKDETLLDKVYTKLDTVILKSPNKIENLYKKIALVKDSVKDKERIYYILTELENYSYKILTSKDNVEYKVENVIDWDSINISYLWNKLKLRLIWINTPEVYTKKECYWDEAKKYLENLIEWKIIKLRFDSTQGQTDKYWRLLWYVFFNWENINNKLIENWYAWEYTYTKTYKYQELFKKSEEKAKNKLKWLWKPETCNWEILEIKKEESEINNDTLKSHSCWEKKYCTQMISCEEAKYYLNSCSLNRLDADKDWIPCESLCK